MTGAQTADVPTSLSKEEKELERVRSSLEKLPARSRVSDACFANAELAQSADRSSSTSRRKVSSVSSSCGGRNAEETCEMRGHSRSPQNFPLRTAETYATHDLVVAHALGEHGRLGFSASVELAGLGWQNVRLTAGSVLGGM